MSDRRMMQEAEGRQEQLGLGFEAPPSECLRAEPQVCAASGLCLLSGPYQSGKTTRLLELAKAGFECGEKVILLVQTASEKNRLQKAMQDISALSRMPDETKAGSFRVETVAAFLQQQALEAFAFQPGQLIDGAGAQVVMARLLGQILCDPEHPHYFAARQPAFQKRLFPRLLEAMAVNRGSSGDNTLPQAFAWVKTLADNVTDWMRQQRLISRPELEEALLQAISKTEAQKLTTHPPVVLSTLLLANPETTETQARTLILIDDVDTGLGQRQLSIFLGWLRNAPRDRRLVLAGRSLDETPLLADYVDAAERVCLDERPQANTSSKMLSELIVWCESADEAPLVLTSEHAYERFLAIDLFSDAQVEARALAFWIQNHVLREKTQVWDASQQANRPCRFSDFLILSRSSEMTRLLVEALSSAQAPVHPENIDVNLSLPQTLVYDALQIFAAFEALQEITGRPMAQLLNSDTPPFKSEEELWERALHSLERLLGLTDGASESGNTSESSRGAENLPEEQDPPAWQILPLLYHGSDLGMRYRFSALNAPGASQLLHRFVLELSGSDNFPERFRRFVEGEQLLGLLYREDASLSRQLEAALWQPLAELGERLTAGEANLPGPCECLSCFFDLWQPLRQSDLPLPRMAEDDAVRIRGIMSVKGKHSPFVCLPFLSQDALLADTATSDLNAFCSGFPQAQAEKNEYLQDAQSLDESWRRLAFAIGRSQQFLWLSAHQKIDQEIAWPHPALMLLLGDRWRRAPHMRALEDALLSMTSENTSSSEKAYEAEGAWANLSPNLEEEDVSKQAVLGEKEGMHPLSPSSLNTYIQCPRQYFYRHLLRLPEMRAGAASAGLLVHRVMEIFNRNVCNGQFAHNAQALLSLAEQFFAFERHKETLLSLGFLERDFDDLRAMNAIAREDLSNLVQLSLQDLAEKGYFKRLENFRRIEPEKDIKGLSLPGLEGVVFNAKIDAIVEFDDGTFDIIDYKFYRQTRFEASPETILSNWQKVLSPMTLDPDTGFVVLGNPNANPTDYQLPLYYWALSQDPKYRGKIRRAVLQMIRPGFGKDNEKGSTPLVLEAYDIEAALEEHVICDLNQNVAAPILNAAHFAPNITACMYCSYTGICQASETLKTEASVA